MKNFAAMTDLVGWASAQMQRPCDLPIGGRDNPYLERWYIVPRNEWQNVYLHRMLRDDDDRALHDHPWENRSLVISGGYREITPEGVFIRKPGDIVTRPATALHRLELIGGPSISLFITGPKIREWGFDCPNGWVHWETFTAGDDGELVGRGCGES